ncbi:hypothetical protein RHGRI_033996 [Rhododendron griersonianum]|uniref:Aminotransferase-like plant mobile domain-containing protein n=1 Tax=Rhododendron griersonianum TaxID=479676 RepID=A0AAV6HZN0_9ERIC|nr:hypothetical protein RHGRI_033996 [Rhododendron griersonianum]
MSGFKVSLKWLPDNFNGKVKEDDDEVTVLRKARCNILQLIGGIVLPDQSSSHVYLCFLSLLNNLQLAGTYSWGSACVATLYHYLDFGSTIGSKDLGGCSYSCKFGVGSAFLSLPPHVMGSGSFVVILLDLSGRANNIVNITDPDILVYLADDPYLDWYERITLRFGSKMGVATNTVMQLFERLSMSYLSVEAVQAMAQKGIECLKFQEKLFRKIAHEHKIRDPQVEEEFDEDYDHVDPHLQAEERVHQQNQPLPQHQPQSPPEDTHAEYQYEEPVATSSSRGPVHPSELSNPFNSAILNMDGVSMSPLLNYSPAAGVGVGAGGS